MLEFLDSELSKNSAIYLLVASTIGGLIGASFKLLFEVVLGGKIAHRRDVENLLQQYKVPLVSASDALAARIGNLVSTEDHKWFETSNYYYLSTLYIFCSYFAWVEVLNGKLLQLRLSDTKKSRKIFRAVILVEKSFNNFIYFRYGAYSHRKQDTGELPKLICKALGEMVIVKNGQGEKECLGFSEFCKKVENDAEFQKWLVYLNDFITSANDEFGNAHWDRLHLVELSLLVLSNVLDPKKLHSSKLSKSKARLILSRIKEPYAREVFITDAVKWRLPFRVESLARNMRREFLRMTARSPELGSFKRYSDYPKDGVEYIFEAKSRQLESKKGRWRLYREIEREFKEKANTIPFGVRVNVVVKFKEGSIPDDVLARLPENITNASKKRTRPEWVTLVKIASNNQ